MTKNSSIFTALDKFTIYSLEHQGKKTDFKFYEFKM